MVPLVESNKIEAALMQGDLSKLSDNERLDYYQRLCKSLGVNPLTQPFQYIVLNNKLTLYATRAGAEQLRYINKISIKLMSKERIGDVYIVTARAIDKNNREDEATGAVALGTARGEVLANLFMKAETKAKRRVTLSISGLGFLDETEVETIQGAQKVFMPENSKDISSTLVLTNETEQKPIVSPARQDLRIISLFERYGVSKTMLEDYVKKPQNEWNKDNINALICLGKEFEAERKDKEGLESYLALENL